MDELAVIVVAYDSAPCIAACLRSVFAHLGSVRADVVVVDAESSGATAEIVGEFARKHFSWAHRAIYTGALLLRHGLLALLAGRDELGARRRVAHWAALRTLLRLSPPPHSPRSGFSVHPRELAKSSPPVQAT